MTFITKAWVNGAVANGRLDAAAMIDLETRLAAYTDLLATPNQWQPSDHGLISWSYDPSLVRSSVILPTAGLVQVVRLKLAQAASITNVCLYVTAIGGTLTANQCLAALYQGTTLKGTTANQATNWQSTGYKEMALTGGPFACTAGDVLVAFFANGTTLPTFGVTGSVAGHNNINLSTANSRYASADTGRTTSFASPIGTLTAGANAWWAGVN